MSRPFRRYCFILAERLGKTLDEIMAMDSRQISEWMAFDRTNDEKWNENYKKELELERQRNLEAKDKLRILKNLFGSRLK